MTIALNVGVMGVREGHFAIANVLAHREPLHPSGGVQCFWTQITDHTPLPSLTVGTWANS